MGYWTYFKGELEIQLKEPNLTDLKTIITQKFNNKDVVIVNENCLKVDDEWKDSGLMEDIVLFIQKYGKLYSGTISCNGEDSQDVWKIFISDNKPFIREKGKFTTLNRSLRKEKYGSSQKSVVEIIEINN